MGRNSKKAKKSKKSTLLKPIVDAEDRVSLSEKRAKLIQEITGLKTTKRETKQDEIHETILRILRKSKQKDYKEHDTEGISTISDRDNDGVVRIKITKKGERDKQPLFVTRRLIKDSINDALKIQYSIPREGDLSPIVFTRITDSEPGVTGIINISGKEIPVNITKEQVEQIASNSEAEISTL